MSDQATDFTGSIPVFYDHGLGPIFFTDFADDIARRVEASAPTRVLARLRRFDPGFCDFCRASD
jgi:hypothetical protein